MDHKKHGILKLSLFCAMQKMLLMMTNRAATISQRQDVDIWMHNVSINYTEEECTFIFPFSLPFDLMVIVCYWPFLDLEECYYDDKIYIFFIINYKHTKTFQ